MRTRCPHHGRRTPAFRGGLVAVLAVALFPLALPAGAADTPEADGRWSVPSVCGDAPAAPDQALHRITTATTGAMARNTQPGGFLPVPAAQPTAAPRAARPAGLTGFEVSTPSLSLRILFCTWLN